MSLIIENIGWEKIYEILLFGNVKLYVTWEGEKFVPNLSSNGFGLKMSREKVVGSYEEFFFANCY